MEFGSSAKDALAATLQALAARVARDYPEYNAAAVAFIERLQAARAGAGAPSVGEAMPPFLAPDSRGELMSLASFAGKPLVLTFMRGHWCDFCCAQAAAMAQAAAPIQAAGAGVAIFTPELPVHAQPLIAAAPAFRLLCDLDNGYATTLGLAAVIDAGLAKHFADFALDIPTLHGARDWVVPIPATFVLDCDGVIVDRSFDPDYRRRPNLDALLDAIGRAGA